jgi:hypothetical protein
MRQKNTRVKNVSYFLRGHVYFWWIESQFRRLERNLRRGETDSRSLRGRRDGRSSVCELFSCLFSISTRADLPFAFSRPITQVGVVSYQLIVAVVPVSPCTDEDKIGLMSGSVFGRRAGIASAKRAVSLGSKSA